jgi:mono/diheme cytochrome c family protein
MRSRSSWALAALAILAALAVAVPFALGASGVPKRTSEPGDPANGKKVYIQFCGKCHTMEAAGSHGTLGPNLDQDKVSYTRVVTSIEEGVGGIQAEYVLRNVKFSQVYDVSKFVVTARR